MQQALSRAFTSWLTMSSLVVLGALSSLGCGQAALKGRVLDDSRQPIRGAAIETVPPTDLLISDTLGMFSIERYLDAQSVPQPLPPGKYQLTIKKLGYEDKVIPVTVGERQEVRLGDITLERKKLDVRVDDVEASTYKGPVGADLISGPYRGE